MSENEQKANWGILTSLLLLVSIVAQVITLIVLWHYGFHPKCEEGYLLNCFHPRLVILSGIAFLPVFFFRPAVYCKLQTCSRKVAIFIFALYLLVFWCGYFVTENYFEIFLIEFGFLIFIFIISAIRFKHLGLLFTLFGLYLVQLIIFSFELPRVFKTSPTDKIFVEWGDSNTFKYLFPAEPPLFGAGGRLRPSQVLMMLQNNYFRKGVRFETNSIGFRNSFEISEKRPEVYRALSLGDSLSNGFQINQDKFFGPLLQLELEKNLGKVEVLNAEVSSPATGLLYLQAYLQKFTPDLVIYNLFSGNDLHQDYWDTFPEQRRFDWQRNKLLFKSALDQKYHSKRYRELMHRYAIGGTAEFNSSLQNCAPLVLSQAHEFKPRINPFFSSFNLIGITLNLIYDFKKFESTRGAEMLPSWILNFEERYCQVSIFDSGRFLALMDQEENKDREQMLESSSKVLSAMNELVTRLGAKFQVVIFPSRLEVMEKDFNLYVDIWNIPKERFDSSLPEVRFAKLCQAYKLDCYDLSTVLRETSQSGTNPFLPGDIHLNEIGHTIAAKSVAEHILHSN